MSGRDGQRRRSRRHPSGAVATAARAPPEGRRSAHASAAGDRRGGRRARVRRREDRRDRDRASVSRATFYELFEDKEACFAQAHGALAQRVGAEIDAAILRAEPADAAGAAIRAIASIAKREPDAASFLTHHALLAGPRPRDSHDRLMSHLERSVEQAWSRSRPATALRTCRRGCCSAAPRGCCA